jgi:hypothetical protein
MNNIVITEIGLAARLFRSGMLKYFNSEELNFFITDFCYDQALVNHNYDRAHCKLMLDNGMLKVVGLSEGQMIAMGQVYSRYKPKFIVKTVSALIFARDNKYKLISEDELLREISRKELSIQSYNKEWLITTLVNEITMMGISININDVKEII